MVRRTENIEEAMTNNESQVLNKRKPVHLIPRPTSISDNAEVFVMKGTDEVFTDYEKYIKRFDWLNQKKFVDAVNGKSGLTYWDALESETKSSASIENVFPEVLRDPILRRVQFSTISRMDDLVSTVYDEFKHDFFPGEDVLVVLDDGEQFDGSIREKAKFPMIRGADGSVQRAPFSRYFVRLLNLDRNEEALLDDKHIRRDRKVFTKQNLRAFLKNSLQREAWNGAPWLVKEHLAIHYRLPMEIPAHLLQDARLLANKQHMLQQQKAKGRRPKNMPPQEFERMQQENMRMQAQQQQHPGALPNGQHFHQNFPQPVAAQPRLPPPPPIIKYPIEDLDIAPKRNGVTRPELKFFTEEMAEYIKDRRTTFTGITMESMGLLLEVWNTLNVQCEVFILDSFTFDDFVDAMNYSSIDEPCELFEEIHCTVLKCFVDKNGAIHAKGLPAKAQETAEDDSEMPDVSEVSTPLPDVPARSTRSRLSHMESAADIPSPGSAGKSNRAVEMLGDRSWVERLAARDFENGGWQVIVVGLLHHLSGAALYKSTCEAVLAELAPEDAEPTRETALEQYANLDINLRISALQILTLLTITTDKVKDFLEACSEDMTDVRKRKIEFQREKKAATEELMIKDRERKILLPENMPESPKDVIEVDLTEDTIDTNGASNSDPDDDAATTGRALRRASDRKRKRDEEAARREKERAEKAEAAKAQPKQSKEFKKILHDMDDLRKRILVAEDNIADCDADLREANVQRTKVLGSDRFCNRYYWFERNGQPFGGLPTSSTADYGYSNGRIWVQGPDDMEREGFIDRTKEDQGEYRHRFNMTVHERRRMEEGGTILLNAREWGYYDDPDRLDNLIGWLDDRGEREKKLRKELVEWRDKIVEYMDAYKTFQAKEAAKKIEADEEHATRITTRHKSQEGQNALLERCLRWTNSMAMEDQEHLHSRPPKPAPKKTKRGEAPVKGVAHVVVSRSKPATRQGR